LTAWLRSADAVLVGATKTASHAVARALLPEAPDGVESWLAGDHLYRLEQSRQRQREVARTTLAPATRAGPRFVRPGALEVRDTLVSNTEFAAFVNAMSSAGMPNGHGGTRLLACEMPHERGGRLHHDPAADRWGVSPGYEDHPVYWVTWIGAAAFAAWSGARLPDQPVQRLL
jgi:Sulfatase-modifying factor enzyme 1